MRNTIGLLAFRVLANRMSMVRYDQLALAGVVGASLIAASPAWAGPKGEQVVAGSAAFTRAGSHTLIEAANNTVINYSRFDILKHETVQFLQPSANARVLNRIAGSSPSHINGALHANGIVYFVNPAGVHFGPDATVSAAGIYAAAGSITDQAFLSGTDAFTGLTGSITNHGRIESGLVHILGRHVANHGTILAPGGLITMAAGDSVYVGQQDGHILVEVAGLAPAAESNAAHAAVENTGTLDAGSGHVNLAAGDMLSLAIQHSGLTRAKSIAITGSPDAGEVAVSGTLDASDATPGNPGGDIAVTGNHIELSSAQLYASGDSAGGNVRVGGNYQGQGPLPNASYVEVDSDTQIHADALTAGDGGRVIFWSDDTTISNGHISARGGPFAGDGGFVETSGKLSLSITTVPDASSPTGKGGDWLIDPTDIDIVPGAGGALGTNIIGADLISNALNLGMDVTLDTSALPEAGEAGTITVQAGAAITKTSGGASDLEFFADSDIEILDDITSTSEALFLVLEANFTGLGIGAVRIDGNITTNGGELFISGSDDGNGVAFGNGVIFNNANADTGGGNITITGTTTDGASSGIEIDGSLNSFGGTIDLTGEGGDGVEIFGAVDSGGGDINISGRGLTNQAININFGGSLNSSGGTLRATVLDMSSSDATLDLDSGTGDIELTFDTFPPSLNGNDLNGTGNLTIQPFTVDRSIGVGTNAAGDLNLRNSFLGMVSGFNTLTIGRDDGSHMIFVDTNNLNNPSTVLRAPAPGGTVILDAGTVDADLDVVVGDTIMNTGPFQVLGSASFTTLSDTGGTISMLDATLDGGVTARNLNAAGTAPGPGSISLVNESLAIAIVSIETAGSLDIDTGAITLTGAVTFGDNAALEVDEFGGVFHQAGGASITKLAGPDALLQITGSNLELNGDILSNGGSLNFILDSASFLFEQGGVDIQGNISTLGGDLTIFSDNAFDFINSGLAVSFSSTSTVDTAGGTINITATSTATPTGGGIVIDSTLFNSNGGDITLDAASDSGLPIDITNSQVDSAGGTIRVTVQETGAQDAVLNLDSGTGDIELTFHALPFSFFASTFNGTGNVTIQPNIPFRQIGIGTLTGELDITQADLDLLTTFNTLTIGRADGSGAIFPSNVTFANPNTAIRAPNGGGIVFDNVTVNGDLVVQSAFTINQLGPIFVAGSSAFTASGDSVFLSNIANTFGGPVELNGALIPSALSGFGPLMVQGAITSGSLTVTSVNGTISTSGPLAVTGNATFVTQSDTGGDINITSDSLLGQITATALDLAGVTPAPGDISIDASTGNADFALVQTAGNLSVIANDIAVSPGPVTVGGDVTLQSSTDINFPLPSSLSAGGTTTLTTTGPGQILLDNAATSFGGPVILNAAGDAFLASAGNTLDIRGTVGGNLNLLVLSGNLIINNNGLNVMGFASLDSQFDNGGGITQAGALAIAGPSSFTVAGGPGPIVLTNTANSFGGSVFLDTAADASLFNNGPTVIHGIVSSNLSVTAQGGDISLFGALAFSGAGTFITQSDSGGDIVLDDPDSQLNGPMTARALNAAGTAPAAGDITISELSGIEITLIETAGSVQIDGSDILLTGPVTFGTNATLSAAGDITQNAPFDQITGGPATLTFNADNNIVLSGDITSPGGPLDVEVIGDFDVSGDGAVVINNSITTNGGNLEISGTNNGQSLGAGFGVRFIVNSSVDTAGGDIQITGIATGMQGLGDDVGIGTEPAAITSGGGDITLFGSSLFGQFAIDTGNTLLDSGGGTIRVAISETGVQDAIFNLDSGTGDIELTLHTLPASIGSSTVTGTGDFTFQTFATDRSIGVGAITGELDLTQAELDQVSGFSSLTIGRADGNHVMNLSNVTLNHPLTTLRAPNVAFGRISLDNTVINGDIVTDAWDVVFEAGPVTINGNATFNANNFIVLDSTSLITKASGPDSTLTFSAGRVVILSNITANSGRLDVNLIGGNGSGDGVVIFQSGSVSTNGGDLTVSGVRADPFPGDAVSIDAASSIDTSGGNIHITGINTSSDGDSSPMGISIQTPSFTSGGGDITLDGSSQIDIPIDASQGINSAGGTITVLIDNNSFQGLDLVSDSGTGDTRLVFDFLPALFDPSNVTGTGNLTIQPFSIVHSIGVGTGAGGALSIPQSVLDQVTGFSSLTIGRLGGGATAVEVANATFSNPMTTLLAQGPGSQISFTNTTINGDLVADSVDVRVDGPLTFSGNLDFIARNNITQAISTAITKTSGPDSTLSLTARNDILLGGNITSTSGRLNIDILADSEADSEGAVQADGVITTNGGDLTIAGSFNTMFTFTGSGVAVNGNVDSGGGNIQITGTNTHVTTFSPEDNRGILITTPSLTSSGGDITLVGSSVDGLAIQADNGLDSAGGTIRVTVPSTSVQDASFTLDSGAGDIELTFDVLPASFDPSNVSGTGNLTIQPFTTTRSIGVGTGAGGLAIPQSVPDQLAGFGSLSIGRADGVHLIRVSDTTFTNPLTILRSPQPIGGGIVFDNVQVNGDLTVDSHGDVTQISTQIRPLSVAGTTRFSVFSGSQIQLQNFSNGFVGPIVLIDTGSARFINATGVAVEGTASTLDVRVLTGPITQSGPLNIASNAIFFAPNVGGSITLTDANNHFNGEVSLVTNGDAIIGDAAIVNGQDLLLRGHIKGALTATVFGAIDIAPDSLQVDGPATFTTRLDSGGAINLSGNFTSFGSLSTMTLDSAGLVPAPGDISIVLPGPGQFDQLTTGGSVSLNASELLVTGAILAPGGIALTAAAGTLTTSVSAVLDSAGADIQITASHLDLAGSFAGTGMAQVTTVMPDGQIDIGVSGPVVFQDGFTAIEIGTATTGQNAITIGDATFNDPVSILSPMVPGSIDITGTIIGLDNASVTIIGAMSTTTLEGDIITAGNAISIDDFIELGDVATVTLDTTMGGVVPTGANIDLGPQIDDIAQPTSLVLNAGSMSVGLTGQVGSVSPPQAIDLAAADIALDASVTTLGNQTYTATNIQVTGGLIESTTGSIAINSPLNVINDLSVLAAGGLDVNGTVQGTGNLTLDVAGPTQFPNGVGSLIPLGSTTGPSLTINSPGSTTFSDVVETNSEIVQADTAGPITFNADVTIGGTNPVDSVFMSDLVLADMTLRAPFGLTLGTDSADSVTISGGLVDIFSFGALVDNAAIDGSATLSITADSLTVSSPIGAVNPVGFLSLRADAIELNAPVSGTGVLTMVPRTPGTAVGLGDGAVGGVHLSSSELGNIQDGFSSITFFVSSAMLQVTDAAFQDPLTLQAPSGGTIALDGTLTGFDDASIEIIAVDPVSLNGDIVTDANPVTIGDLIAPFDVVVIGPTSAVQIDTTMGGLTPAGSDINVRSPVNNPGNSTSLTLNAGLTGAVTLQQDIGTVDALAAIDISAADINLPMTVTTIGDQTYSAASGGAISPRAGTIESLAGNLQFQGNLSVSDSPGLVFTFISAADTMFTGNVNGSEFIDVTSGGATTFNAPIGAVIAPAGLNISADQITTQGINTNGGIALVAVDSITVGPITSSGFAATAGGSVTLAGAIASTSPLLDISIGAGTLTVDQALTNTVGDITLSAPAGIALNAPVQTNTATGQVLLTTPGAVTAGPTATPHITANALALDATSVGTPANPLTTQVSQLAATITAAGGLNVSNTGDLVITDIASLSGIDAGAGPVMLSAASMINVTSPITSTMPINLMATTGVTVEAPITTTSSIMIDAGIDGPGSTGFEVLATGIGGSLTAAMIALHADTARIEGPLTATGQVSIEPASLARAISLGADAPGTLSLDDVELNQVTVGTELAIGSSTAGDITLLGSVALTPPAVADLRLTTGAGVGLGPAPVQLSVQRVRVVAQDSVIMNTDSDEATLLTATDSIDITNAGDLLLVMISAPSGDLNITSTTGNLDTTTPITAAGSATFTAAGSVGIANSITATSGPVTITAGDSIGGGGFIVSPVVQLSAVSGIGVSTPVQLATSMVSADNTGAGPVNVRNTFALGAEATSLTTGMGDVIFDQATGALVVTGNAATGTLGSVNGGDLSITSPGGLTLASSALVDTRGGSGGGVNILNSVTIDAPLMVGAGSVTLSGGLASGTGVVFSTDQVIAAPIVLFAPGNVTVNANFQTIGDFDISITADSDGDGSGGIHIGAAGQVVSGGDVIITGANGAGGLSVFIEGNGLADVITAAGSVFVMGTDAAPSAQINIGGGIVAADGIAITSANGLSLNADLIAGTVIDLDAGMGAIQGAAALNAADLQLTASKGIGSSEPLSVETGSVSALTTTGNIGLNHTAGSTLEITGLSALNGNIKVFTDDLNINGPVGAGGSAQFAPMTPGNTIGVGTTGQDFNLTQTEINQISAETLVVGSPAAGNLFIGEVTVGGPTNNIKNLTLWTGATINEDTPSTGVNAFMPGDVLSTPSNQLDSLGRLSLFAGSGIGQPGGLNPEDVGPLDVQVPLLIAQLSAPGEVYISDRGGVVLLDVQTSMGDILIRDDTFIKAESVIARSDVTLIVDGGPGAIPVSNAIEVGAVSASGDIIIIAPGGGVMASQTGGGSRQLSAQRLEITAIQVGTTGRPVLTRTRDLSVDTSAARGDQFLVNTGDITALNLRAGSEGDLANAGNIDLVSFGRISDNDVGSVDIVANDARVAAIAFDALNVERQVNTFSFSPIGDRGASEISRVSERGSKKDKEGSSQTAGRAGRSGSGAVWLVGKFREKDNWLEGFPELAQMDVDWGQRLATHIELGLQQQMLRVVSTDQTLSRDETERLVDLGMRYACDGVIESLEVQDLQVKATADGRSVAELVVVFRLRKTLASQLRVVQMKRLRVERPINTRITQSDLDAMLQEIAVMIIERVEQEIPSDIMGSRG